MGRGGLRPRRVVVTVPSVRTRIPKKIYKGAHHQLASTGGERWFIRRRQSEPGRTAALERRLLDLGVAQAGGDDERRHRPSAGPSHPTRASGCSTSAAAAGPRRWRRPNASGPAAPSSARTSRSRSSSSPVAAPPSGRSRTRRSAWPTSTRHRARAPFDAAVSQFGVMFFDEPVTAFANIRRHVAPSGRLAFACWQPVERNPWFIGPALAGLAPPPPPPAPGKSPTGPFSLSDPERVDEILSGAGWTSTVRTRSNWSRPSTQTRSSTWVSWGSWGA